MHVHILTALKLDMANLGQCYTVKVNRPSETKAINWESPTTMSLSKWNLGDS